MRKIQDRPTDDEWEAWRAEAEARTKELVIAAERGEKRRKIDERFYKQPRRSLLRFTNEKCAYCEQYITANSHLGDIDHYRPKGGVKDAAGRPVRRTDGELHDGYWWLAYDPHNLLPSCIGCNRYASNLDGKGSGKWDRFPVAGEHATRPSEVQFEKPLLINPWVDDPAEHLVFDDELGIVGARTKRGMATIAILDLNRERLRERRRDVISKIQLLFADAACSYRKGNEAEVKAIVATFADYRDGRTELSATALARLVRETIRENEFFNLIVTNVVLPRQ